MEGAKGEGKERKDGMSEKEGILMQILTFPYRKELL